MTSLLSLRVWIGMFVAVLAAILVSFIGGCFYSIVLGYPEMPKINEAMEVFLFIGGTAAIVAGMVTTVSLLLIGLPLYITSIQKRTVSFRVYVLGGFVTSLILGLLLAILHMSRGFLIAEDFYFAAISILIAGPVVTSVFWVIVRPDQSAHRTE